MRFCILLLCLYTTLQLSQSTNQNAVLENSNKPNQRPKRFIPLLTNGLGLTSSFGAGTSSVGTSTGFFQILVKLFNIATSQQNLLLKRKCLNLIMRASSFMLNFLPEPPVEQNTQLLQLNSKFKKKIPRIPKIPVITQAPLRTTENILEAESVIVNNIVEIDNKNISKRSAEDYPDDLVIEEEGLINYRKYIDEVDSLITLLEAGDDKHHVFKRSDDLEKNLDSSKELETRTNFDVLKEGLVLVEQNEDKTIGEVDKIGAITEVTKKSVEEFVEEMKKILEPKDDVIKKVEENTAGEILPIEDFEEISSESFTGLQNTAVHVEVHKTITEDSSQKNNNLNGLSKNKTKPSNLVIIYPEGYENVLDELVVTSPTLKIVNKTTENISDEASTIVDGLTEESVLDETYQTTEFPGENLSELEETIINNINEEGKYTINDDLNEDKSKKVVLVVVHKFLLKNNQSSNDDEIKKSKNEEAINEMIELLNDNEDEFDLEAKARFKRDKSGDEMQNNQNKRHLGTDYFAGVTSRFRQISPSFQGFSSSNHYNIPLMHNKRYPSVFKKEKTGSYQKTYQNQIKKEETSSYQKTHPNPIKKDETISYQKPNQSQIKKDEIINKDHYFNYFPFYERRVNFKSQNQAFNSAKNFETSQQDLTNGTTFIFKSLPHYKNNTSFKSFDEKKVETNKKPENSNSGSVFIFKSLPLYKNNTSFKSFAEKNVETNKKSKNSNSGSLFVFKSLPHFNVPNDFNKPVLNENYIFKSLPLFKTWNGFNKNKPNHGVKRWDRTKYENARKAALENRRNMLKPILENRVENQKFQGTIISGLKNFNEVQEQVLNKIKPVPLTVEEETSRGYLLNDLLPNEEIVDTKPWARPAFSRGDTFDGSEEIQTRNGGLNPNNQTNKIKLKWVAVDTENSGRTRLNTTVLSFALKALKERNDRNRLNFSNPNIPTITPQNLGPQNFFPGDSRVGEKIVLPNEAGIEIPGKNSYIKPHLSVTKEDITKLEHDPPSPTAYDLVKSNFGRHFRVKESGPLALEVDDVLFYDKKPKTAFTSYGVSINK